MARRIRVIHVEDDPEFAELVATFIEKLDDRIRVDTATGAVEGLERLRTEPHDCIVSDYDMPGTHGIEFLRSVREEFPDLPFILFTGKGSEEVASEAISSGVSDYLQKGGSERYSLLANRIVNLVEKHRAEQGLKTRARQQEIVAELGQQALEGTDRHELFDAALCAVCEVLETEFAKMLAYDPEQDEFELRAGIGWDDTIVGEGIVQGGQDSQAGYTIQTEQPVVVDSLATEDRFRGPPLLTEHEITSGLSTIIGSTNDPWGVLGTHSRTPHEFSEYDINFVQNVATVLSTLIARDEHESALSLSERRFNAIFHNRFSFMALLEPDGTVIDINRVALEFIGEDECVFEGMPFAETPWWTHSERLQSELRSWIERAASGDITRFEARHYGENDAVTIDGVLHPIRESNGEIVELLAAGRDISDRIAYERQLERHRENLEHLLQASTALYEAETVTECHELTIEAAVSILGFDWCTLARPAPETDEFEIVAVSEGTPVSVGDRPFATDEGLAGQVFQSKEPTIVSNAQQATQARPTSSEIGSALTVPVGSWGIFQAVSTSVEDFDEQDRKHAELLVAAMNGAVERIEQRQRLRERNSRLHEFASIVSHDLRNPLTIAQGRLELAMQGGTEEHLPEVQRAHDRISELIEDLLLVARLETADPDRNSVAMQLVTENSWANVESAEATLINTVSGEIIADRSRLQQLLENLFRNSIEHSGSAVTVTVGRISTEGFYVSDDGPSIPQDDLEDVFEFGFSTQERGTGFGLSIVRQVCEDHGWEIQITDAETGGARFEVTGVEFETESGT